MTTIKDAPGMLRARLREDQRDLPTVLVVAEHAERAAFARQAFAIKLRELDVVCAERDRLNDLASRIQNECRNLAIFCERHDADLEAAINGSLRKAT